MNKETLGALKELLTKIPEEDLKKAAERLPADTLEKLSGGGLWDSIVSFFKFGKSSQRAQASPLPSPESAVRRLYSSNEEIRNAFLAGEIKGLRNLRNAYKSIHPSFKGTIQDVLTILGV